MTVLEFLDKWVRGRFGPSEVKQIIRDLGQLEGMGKPEGELPSYVYQGMADVEAGRLAELPHGRDLTFRERQARDRALVAQAKRDAAARREKVAERKVAPKKDA